MNNLVLAAHVFCPLFGLNEWVLDIALAIPLILAIGFVYAATRHEDIAPIIIHGAKLSMMLATFMLALFGLLIWLGQGL